MRDVAKAQKHVELTRGDPRIRHVGQVKPRSMAFGEAKFGVGRFGGSKQVVVETTPGEFEYIESIVKGALTFLEVEMNSLGYAL